MADTVIRFESVSKRFKIYHEKHSSLKENVLTMFRNRKRWEDFWALKDVDFEVPRGQMIGIIGENGSGKSTSLKLLARILSPDEGTVSVTGSLSALIELGAGFHPDFTGKENIYLNAAILGFSRKEIDEKFDDIVRFAELEKFIDTPVRNYSSGMYMRLGFSIAIHVDPDILLIDEIFAVGDEAFQQKCIKRIEAFREAGKTIVFVSHALPVVEALCDRAVLLHGGRLAADGPPFETVAEYRRLLGVDAGIQVVVPEPAFQPPAEEDNSADLLPVITKVEERLGQVDDLLGWLEKRMNEPISIENARERLVQLEEALGATQRQGSIRDQALKDLTRKFDDLENRISTLLTEGTVIPLPRQYGTRQVEILEVDFRDKRGNPNSHFRSGDPMTIHVTYRVNKAVNEPVIGLSFVDQKGQLVFGSNTSIDHVGLVELGESGVVEIRLERLALLGGLFYVTIAIHPADQTVQYHTVENYYQIQVEPRRNYEGHVDMECDWRVSPATRGDE